MKVMILTADYPPAAWSGIGPAVALQARALAALGVETHVMVARGERRPSVAPVASVAEEGLTIHWLSGARFPMDAREFDLVHLHSLALSELALELRRRFRLPLVYTAHSWLPSELGRSAMAAFWCAVQGRVMAASNRVIFLNESERAAAVALLPELRLRARKIPNAIPPPVACETEPESGLLVFAGRFARSKGIAVLVEVIERVLAERPIRLALAGGHGDAESERLIGKLVSRFPDNALVAGWLDRARLDALLARAALVLMPSLYEPFGLVALEAMRMGAPVLAAAVGGLKEIVTEESGGRLIGSHEPAEWSEATLNLLSDSQARRSLRHRGPRYVAENFNPARIAARLIEEAYAV